MDSNIVSAPMRMSNKMKPWHYAVGIFFAPIGLIMAVYFFFKAKQTRLASQLLVLSIIGLVLYYLAYSLWFYGNLERYNYQKIDSFTLQSKTKNASLEFQKPTEFTQSYQSVELSRSDVLLAHKSSKGDATGTLGYISANIINSSLAANAAYKKELTKQMDNHTGVIYDNFLDSYKQSLAASVPNNYSIEMNSPSSLQTQNIKSSAWVYDFTASSTDSRVNNYSIDGKFVVAAGQKTFYYFTLASVNYNWNRNQSIWDEVLDSIKIDQ